jgi:hypothetical protein
MQEKLVITLEVDKLPEDTHFIDFQMTVMEKGWLTRVFKDWRKITYKKAIVTNMVVEKI